MIEDVEELRPEAKQHSLGEIEWRWNAMSACEPPNP
jgi:hypothetical protein